MNDQTCSVRTRLRSRKLGIRWRPKRQRTYLAFTPPHTELSCHPKPQLCMKTRRDLSPFLTLICFRMVVGSSLRYNSRVAMRHPRPTRTGLAQRFKTVFSKNLMKSAKPTKSSCRVLLKAVKLLIRISIEKWGLMLIYNTTTAARLRYTTH